MAAAAAAAAAAACLSAFLGRTGIVGPDLPVSDLADAGNGGSSGIFRVGIFLIGDLIFSGDFPWFF